MSGDRKTEAKYKRGERAYKKTMKELEGSGLPEHQKKNMAYAAKLEAQRTHTYRPNRRTLAARTAAAAAAAAAATLAPAAAPTAAPISAPVSAPVAAPSDAATAPTAAGSANDSPVVPSMASNGPVVSSASSIGAFNVPSAAANPAGASTRGFSRPTFESAQEEERVRGLAEILLLGALDLSGSESEDED